MSTENLVYDDRLEIVRKINQKISIWDSSNIEELFSLGLKQIGKVLECSSCAVLEAKEAESLVLIDCYKKQQKSYLNKILKSTHSAASDAMLKQQVSYKNIDISENIYYVPIINSKTIALMFSFTNKLNEKEMDVLLSIGNIFASAIEKLLLKQQLKQQYLSTVKSLVVAIEAKDVYTQGHSQRVAGYSKMIGKHLKLKDEEINELEITGLVHDIGKIGINDNLLTKPNKLTELEFDTIKQHPEIGLKILKPLGVSENVMMGTLLHHKRYDLKGYPCNMNIDRLPLVPAIIGVADAFDAMTSERNYRKTISKHAALQELKKYKGTQFDPTIVDVMEELVMSEII